MGAGRTRFVRAPRAVPRLRRRRDAAARRRPPDVACPTPGRALVPAVGRGVRARAVGAHGEGGASRSPTTTSTRSPRCSTCGSSAATQSLVDDLVARARRAGAQATRPRHRARWRRRPRCARCGRVRSPRCSNPTSRTAPAGCATSRVRAGQGGPSARGRQRARRVGRWGGRARRPGPSPRARPRPLRGGPRRAARRPCRAAPGDRGQVRSVPAAGPGRGGRAGRRRRRRRARAGGSARPRGRWCGSPRDLWSRLLDAARGPSGSGSPRDLGGGAWLRDGRVALGADTAIDAASVLHAAACAAGQRVQFERATLMRIGDARATRRGTRCRARRVRRAARRGARRDPRVRGARPRGRARAAAPRVGAGARAAAAQRVPPLHRRPALARGGGRGRRVARPGRPAGRGVRRRRRPPRAARRAAARRAAARHRQGSAGRPLGAGAITAREVGGAHRARRRVDRSPRVGGRAPPAARRHRDASRSLRRVHGRQVRARDVGDVARNDLLYALTIADSRATGPSAWNTGKAALVRELFVKADTLLAGGRDRRRGRRAPCRVRGAGRCGRGRVPRRDAARVRRVVPRRPAGASAATRRAGRAGDRVGDARRRAAAGHRRRARPHRAARAGRGHARARGLRHRVGERVHPPRRHRARGVHRRRPLRPPRQRCRAGRGARQPRGGAARRARARRPAARTRAPRTGRG